jgi:MraZ protein
MSYFNGEFAHKIDQKGRVFVPRGFMDAIDDSHERESFECVINSIDGCLEIYTASEFAKYIEANLRNEKNASRAKKLRRSLGANSRKLKVDAQGRVLLPEELRSRIDLSGERAANRYVHDLDLGNTVQIMLEDNFYADAVFGACC